MTKNLVKDGSATAFIERYLPDFCWQTAMEIQAMIEAFDENTALEYCSLKALLSVGITKGQLLKRRLQKPTISRACRYDAKVLVAQIPSTFEYIRNPNWKKGRR